MVKPAKFVDEQAKFAGKPPREAPPPSRWGRSRLGHDFIVRKVGYRNTRGKKLYKLGFLKVLKDEPGKALFSSHLWTLDELNTQGVVWLDKCPVAQVIEEPDRDPVPEGAMVDDEDDGPVSLPPATPLISLPSHQVVESKCVKHKKSGNLYKIHERLPGDMAVVSQVLPDGKPTPKRKLSLASFEAAS